MNLGLVLSSPGNTLALHAPSRSVISTQDSLLPLTVLYAVPSLRYRTFLSPITPLNMTWNYFISLLNCSLSMSAFPLLAPKFPTDGNRICYQFNV